MGQTWLYRFLGVGGVPNQLRRRLESEGVIVLDEGIGGTITYRDFRAPGKAYHLKESWFSGAMALTKVRFVAFAYGSQIVNIPWDDPRRQELQVTCEDEEHLLVIFDPAIFHDDWSGTVEVRLATQYARQAHARLTR